MLSPNSFCPHWLLFSLVCAKCANYFQIISVLVIQWLLFCVPSLQLQLFSQYKWPSDECCLVSVLLEIEDIILQTSDHIKLKLQTALQFNVS